MAKIIFNDWSESVFRNLQPEYNGGIMSVLSRAESFDDFQKPSTFIKWLEELSHKPYFNVCCGIAILWALVLPITVFIFLIRICCRNLSCCSQCRGESVRLLSLLSEKCLKRKLQIDCAFCKKRGRRANFMKRDCVTCAIFLTTAMLLFGLSAGIYFTVTGNTRFKNTFEKSNYSSSLSFSFDEIITQVELFFDDGIKEANTTTIQIVNDFNAHFKKAVGDFVNDLTQRLLMTFGATSTLSTAEIVINGINGIFKAMNYIKNNRQVLFKDINEFRGGIRQFIRPFIERELPKLCDSSSDESFKLECRQVLTQCSLLQNNLREDQIMFDTSSAVLYVLRLLNLDMSILSRELETSKIEVQKIVTQMNEEAERQFQIDKILADVPTLWNWVDKEVNTSIKVPLLKFQKSDSVQTYLSVFVEYWRPVFDGALAVIVFMGITSLLTCIVVIPIYLHSQSQEEEERRRNAYEMKLDVLYSNTQHPSNWDAIKPEDKSCPKQKSHPVFLQILRVLTAMHLIFGAAVTFACLFAGACFLFGGVLTTEVCRYLVEPKGVTIANDVVNSLIAEQWDNMTSQINLTQMVLPATLKMPQDTLIALYSKCSSQNATLLRELNMTGIFNAEEFPNLPLYKSMAATGEQVTINRVKNLGLNSIIPTSLLSFIDQGIDFLRKFVDPMNYTSSVAELKKPILMMNDSQFFAFVNRLDSLLRRSSDNQHSIALRHAVTLLQNLTNPYKSFSHRQFLMRQQFELLKNSPQMSDKLKNLKTMIIQTQANLNDKNYLELAVRQHYPNVLVILTNTLVKKLVVGLDALEKSLFPCRPLHVAYKIMTGCMCENVRMPLNSFTLAIGITVLWVQLLFYFSWCLLSHMKPKIYVEDQSDC